MVFCKHCGKIIEDGTEVCPECLAAQGQPQPTEPQPVVTQPQQTEPQTASAQPQTNAPAGMTNKYFFGQALAATIIGAIGCVFGNMGLNWLLEIFNTEVSAGNLRPGEYIQYYFMGMPADRATIVNSAIAVGLIGLGLGIAGLILGILALKANKKAKSYGIKTTPTMVLGIVGTVTSSLAILSGLLIFMMAGI